MRCYCLQYAWTWSNQPAKKQDWTEAWSSEWLHHVRVLVRGVVVKPPVESGSSHWRSCHQVCMKYRLRLLKAGRALIGQRGLALVWDGGYWVPDTTGFCWGMNAMRHRVLAATVAKLCGFKLLRGIQRWLAWRICTRPQITSPWWVEHQVTVNPHMLAPHLVCHFRNPNLFESSTIWAASWEQKVLVAKFWWSDLLTPSKSWSFTDSDTENTLNFVNFQLKYTCYCTSEFVVGESPLPSLACTNACSLKRTASPLSIRCTGQRSDGWTPFGWIS